MIASLYRLSRTDIAKLKVSDDYSIHRIVYSLFPKQDDPDTPRGFLYADKGGNFMERTILILSRNQPAEPEAGFIESREVSEKFLLHPSYAFEVVMNPSRRDARTTKTVAIRGEQELRTWFIGKTSGWGFSVDESRLTISHVGIQSFDHKSDGTVVHGRATYSGTLEVHDKALFQKCFEDGLGRCRGFGFGLLQLRPLVPVETIHA